MIGIVSACVSPPYNTVVAFALPVTHGWMVLASRADPAPLRSRRPAANLAFERESREFGLRSAVRSEAVVSGREDVEMHHAVNLLVDVEGRPLPTLHEDARDCT